MWDVRQDTSVKLARSTRGTGTRTRVRPSAKIPNWQNFLRVGDNLSELQDLIATHIQGYKKEDKTLVTTLADSAVSNNIAFNNTNLSPSTHEEADYRMILHISDMTRYGCRKIKVLTIDTDVVIICLAYYHLINNLNELWLMFGRGKSKRFIPIHTTAENLGREKCIALLGFHAITGCDSVSAFYGRGKKHAWEVWNKFPAVTEAFTHLSQAPDSIPKNIMGLVEQFVVRLYSNTLENVTTVNKARFELFQFGGKDFDHLPPTQNALKHHVQRAAYTAGHIWGQALQKCPEMPSTLLLGI